jgi:hypothetical protein
MSRKTVTFDSDNPEWTDEDFARARYGDDIPADIHEAFGVPGREASIGRLVAAQGMGFSRAGLRA